MDTIVDFLINFSGPTPYLIIFGVLLLCGLGLPVPEDITLFIGGILAYYGLCDLTTMILVCLAGVLLGDSIMFWLGERYGRQLTRKWFFRKMLPEDRLDSVRERFARWGNKVIFIARFMPGLRAPIFFSAGTFHLPFSVFFFYDGLAALLSVPAIVGCIYYFGDQLEKVIRIIKKMEHGIILTVALVVLAMVIKWYWTHRKLRNEKVSQARESS